MRVLVADQTSEKLLERLRGGGLEVDYRPGIPRDELLKVSGGVRGPRREEQDQGE